MRLRNNYSDVSDATGEPTMTRRRGEGRGWGPFSGGQLTAIILGVLVAIAFPVGAWAVSGTTVFVTDAVSGTHAKVNSLGQLSVAAIGSVTATATADHDLLHVGRAPREQHRGARDEDRDRSRH